MQIFTVGGAVRDALLGLPVHDRDFVVVGSTPAEMLRLGYRQVGADFPVFLNPVTKEEYALARTERKTGVGYQGFSVDASPNVTLEEDLSRRDLTINAIAQADDGTLTDPFNGQADIAHKVLRHVGPAFAEDPVRILRIARFSARYADFTVARETMALMRIMVTDGEVDHLVAERVWQELSRGLMEKKPSRMLDLLHECGALARLLPEVDRLFGVGQPVNHPEGCVGTHVKLVLDYAAYQGFSLPVRFAALLHAVGIGLTQCDQWPAHHDEERGLSGVESICNRFKVPAACRELAVLVTRFQTLVHRAEELTVTRLVKLLEQVDGFRRPQRFEEFLQTCEAVARGRLGMADSPYPQSEVMRRSLAAARAVDTGAIAEKLVQKALIPQHIHAARVVAIQESLRDKGH
jgi:tRNA nucleotidyltransferase (CCA-adding enzyme)